jgi:hypothetical protein
MNYDHDTKLWLRRVMLNNVMLYQNCFSCPRVPTAISIPDCND